MRPIIIERIKTFKALLKAKSLDAFIIPSSDPHLSEYVASHWKVREWISGFTGSAGTIAITQTEVGLWTDSRYFAQASEQLEGTGITLYKEMLAETPSIETFLLERLRPGDRVGIEGQMFSTSQVERLKTCMDEADIQVVNCEGLIGSVWTDRPAIPVSTAYIHDIRYAGTSSKDKIAAIRTNLRKGKAAGILLSALNEIAWTLNLRGDDIHCNPVIISYLLITQDESVWFVSSDKLTEDVRHYLEEQHVRIRPYHEIGHALQELNTGSLLIDPGKTNYSIYTSVNPSCRIIRGESPVALLKATRNQQEQEGIHAAMQRDGVALVRFLKWLEEAVHSGKETELSISRKLHDFRACQPLYKGDSFDTIAGYKEHGAIVHYSATPESDATLHPEGFLLLDSGGQYLDGTTDITRTIALGELSEEEKTDYTLILKGHIALAMAKFPEGTRGTQLDVLARMPLWKQNMNYLHGTGHGVGHFLSVHEGPQSIRMNENPVPLLPGMVTSNEPGIYKAGKHGIRIENLTLVRETGEGMFGKYLELETITLCPICKKGIIREMMTQEETEWLNDYHRTVYEKLSPDLTTEEKAWLKDKTSPSDIFIPP